MIVVVYLITTIVFFMARLSPYDPITLILGQKSIGNPLAVARLRHLFGLDQPMWRQYLNYLGDLMHGNLGYSEEQGNLGEPVWTILRVGVPVSLKLSGLSLLLSLIIGLPIGMLSALKQNSPIDHGSQFVTMVAYAVPPFVLAPIAQLVFGVQLGWLPVSGWGDPGILGIKEMVMPVGLFAIGLAGFFAKSMRSFMLEILSQDYVRTARAKGLKQRVIIYLHVAKNTLMPLASIVGPTAATLILGFFIIENFFAIPGIGNITVQAIVNNNYPVIEATTILLAASVVFVNFLTDIFYAMVDPRVRL
jgi:ABC-type dipeptide/oligopeptide/nickel transport system permease component